jgi:hypothetical protein
MEAKICFKAFLNLPPQLGRVRVFAFEYDVAALDVGEDILQAQRFMQGFEVSHSYLMVSSDIDGTE